MAEKRAHAVRTGYPEVQLLACSACGVLLWDIDAHYAHAHPEPTDSGFCAACGKTAPGHFTHCRQSAGSES